MIPGTLLATLFMTENTLPTALIKPKDSLSAVMSVAGLSLGLCARRRGVKRRGDIHDQMSR